MRALARLPRQAQAADGAFALAYPPSCTNVCFWYVPEAMRPLPPAAELSAAHPVHEVAIGIKARLQQEGGAMIGFQSVNGLPNFFRWVFASTDTVTKAHVEGVLQRIAELGEEVAAELPDK